MARRRRSNNTGSIFKDANGYWNAQIFLGFNEKGKRHTKRKRSKTEAVVVAWLNAEIGKSPQAAVEKFTVEQYLRRWLEQVKHSSSYSTWRTYEILCKRHIFGRLGKIPLRSVTQAQIQGLINALEKHAFKTVTLIRHIIRKALNDAMVEKFIPENPAIHVKLPNEDRSQAFEAHWLTAEQSQWLLTAVEGHRNKALFWVALLTGLRKGEVLALRIEDVDFAAQTLRIAASVAPQTGKGMVRKSTKNRASEVTIPFPGVLVPILKEHLAMLTEERTDYRWKEQGLLFPNTRGGFMSASTPSYQLKQALKAANLPEDVRFHDLRHSCATLLITLGVHPRIIMEILRHSQISTTMNLYGHTIPEVNRSALDQLGELIAPATLEIPARKVPKE